jgi:hypothetical protein
MIQSVTTSLSDVVELPGFYATDPGVHLGTGEQNHPIVWSVAVTNRDVPVR